MTIKKTTLLIIMLLYGELSFADCTYNGIKYPTGTVLGPYVCNGSQWIIRR